jgi:signal transduction histidine kinase
VAAGAACDDRVVSSLVSRLARRGRPLRVRLTFAFASVIALVLAATGVLVYAQLARDLDARTDAGLAERQAQIRALASGEAQPQRLIALSGERLAQIYRGSGALLASSRRLAADRVLTAKQVQRARRRVLLTDASVRGTDDGARLRAFAVAADRVVVIGEPLDDREHALQRLALLLALALPGALLLASLAGYQVARAALRPVERMRTTAARIGEGDLKQRLPQPGTDDELDRLAETLNDLLARLATAVERERRIVGDASHELRTPISVLRTRLDVALLGDDDPMRLRAVIEDARRDSQRLSRLADDLLVLARADQGRLPLRLQPLDVHDILEHTAARHATSVGAAGRRVVVGNRIGGGAVVLADSDHIARALDNLVVNALRHGTGDIEVCADTAEHGAVAVSVRDHGDGYPDAFLPHAFERFSQADDSHGQAGSGLGLAIVHAITHAHGGAVTAANHPDGGALTTITLPHA